MEDNRVVVKLNCMTTNRSKIASCLVEEMMKKSITKFAVSQAILSRSEAILDALFEGSSTTKQDVDEEVQIRQTIQKLARFRFLLVLDEIDSLVSRNVNFLYKLFEWPNSSSLILIAISNSVDLTNRFLPLLRNKQIEPNFINFVPYKETQLHQILMERIAAANAQAHEKDNALRIFDSKAVELCARKVAATTGDVRQALEILKRTYKEFQENNKDSSSSNNGSKNTINNNNNDNNNNNNNNNNNENKNFGCSDGKENSKIKPAIPISKTSQPQQLLQPGIKLKQVSKVVGEFLTSKFSSRIRDLPSNLQFLLCAAVSLSQSSKNFTIAKLTDFYSSFAAQKQLPAISAALVPSLCQTLQDYSLLKMGTAKDDRLKKITLNVSENDIKEAFAGSPLASTLF